MGGSVVGLEERFQKLRLLQEQLAIKRKELGLDKPERSENSEKNENNETEQRKEPGNEEGFKKSVQEPEPSNEPKAEVVETTEPTAERASEEKDESSSSQNN